MSTETQSRRAVLWSAIALAMLLSLVMTPIPWGDSAGSVFGALSFLCEGDWDYDEFPFLYEQAPHGPLTHDQLRNVHPSPDGQDLLSFTGLGVKLIHLPVTAVALFPWTGTTSELAALRANQVTGLLCCLAILLLVGSTFRSQLPGRWSTLALAALFFGTTLWPQCRQTLWSNEAALLGISLVLWASYRARKAGLTPLLTACLGLGTGWAVMTRPGSLVLCLPLLLAVAWEHRSLAAKRLPILLGAGLPFAGLLLWDNHSHTGSLWTPPFVEVASEIARRMGEEQTAFGGGLFSGLAGSLFSPSRGLLIFSPFLVLAPLGALGAWRDRDLLGIAMALGVAGLVLLNATYADWWGAACWGPRRLLEALPFATLLAFRPLCRPEQRIPAALPWGLLALSISVQALGFFLYDSSWDAEKEPTQRLELVDGELRYTPRDEAQAILWSVREGVLLQALRGELQFGLDSDYSLATGRIAVAPIPECTVLRAVDRYPAAESSTDPR